MPKERVYSIPHKRPYLGIGNRICLYCRIVEGSDRDRGRWHGHVCDECYHWRLINDVPIKNGSDKI